LREENLAFKREREDRIMEGWAWLALGVEAMHRGSYEEARPAARSALAVSKASGDREVFASSHMALGRLALAAGAYGEAHEWLQRSIALYEQVGRMYWIAGEALVAQVYAARGLGQPAQARGHLGEVFHLLIDTRNFTTALHSLPAAALLWMDAGEVERAVELYALASSYPFVANSRWFEDVAGREISAAAETLPPEVVACAQERGQSRDLWATVQELLEELGGSPPG
jgi:tetratricopeptide (TPR) repeat protein